MSEMSFTTDSVKNTGIRADVFVGKNDHANVTTAVRVSLTDSNRGRSIFVTGDLSSGSRDAIRDIDELIKLLKIAKEAVRRMTRDIHDYSELPPEVSVALSDEPAKIGGPHKIARVLDEAKKEL